MSINDLLNTESDYSHLALPDEFKATVVLSKAEQEAVLAAYDQGVGELSGERLEDLNHVLSKLKDEIWT
jgi:hypothetical protein